MWANPTSFRGDIREGVTFEKTMGDGAPRRDLLLHEVAPRVNTLFEMLGFHVMRRGKGRITDGLKHRRFTSKGMGAHRFHAIGPFWTELLDDARQA